MALPLKDLQQLHLKIINTCEVAASKPGSQQGENACSLSPYRTQLNLWHFSTNGINAGLQP